MHLETKRLETSRLILRPFQGEDAEDMFRNYCADPDVTKFLTWATYTSIQDAHERIAFLQAQYAKGEAWDWAIVHKEIGQVIGSIGVVSVSEKVSAVEVGYCIGRRWWRQGITSEAFSALIDDLFTNCGVNRITSRHDPNNPGSGAVMRKCGLRYEGTARQADWNNQGLCDAAHYAILKDDYIKGEQTL